MANRDPRTGRFAATQNVSEASEGKFPTYLDVPVEDVSGAPSRSTIDVPRHAPEADDLGQLDARSPLRGRHPTLVAMDEAYHGQQAARVRDAARLHGVGGVIRHVLGVNDSEG